MLRSILCMLALLTAHTLAFAAEHHRQVTFGGLPVPGAVLTVTQNSNKLTTITDQQGLYFFPALLH